MPDQQPPIIIFFDGVCHLCNGFVDWMISKDKKGVFVFAPLQGETAKKYLPADDIVDPNSVIVLSLQSQGQQILKKSSAVLFAIAKLSSPWKFISLLRFIPQFIRDPLYDLIAKNRYSIFGKRDFCRIPQSHEKNYLWP